MVAAGPTPVERYREAYRAFVANGASRAPAWLARLRQAAITRFGELGFPTMKQEEWRFTSVAPIAETEFALSRASHAPRPTPEDIEPFLLADAAPHRLVFVDGRFSERLSRLTGVPAGVTVGSLAGALGARGDVLERHLGRYAGYQDNPFRALNTAFVWDGAFVHVPAGVELEKPVYVRIANAVERGSVFWRLLIVAEPQGSYHATIVEQIGRVLAAAFGVDGVTWLLMIVGGVESRGQSRYGMMYSIPLSTYLPSGCRS